MIIDIFKVFLLSLVEAFTEFIPVSSTGHMILLENLIKLSENKVFVNAFQIIIQLGAILAVVVVFFNEIYPFKYKGEKRNELFSLWKKIIVAVLPAVILGLLFDDLIDKYLFNPIIVSIMLVIYGVLLVFIESKNKKVNVESVKDISYTMAIYIGLFQCLAMIPGTSRSAATIIGAMLIGLSRIAATEFSFYLAIPTMLGATSLKLIKLGNILTYYELILIFLGLILTFIMSLYIIKGFMKYIKNRDFKLFGYYRIILGLIVLIFSLWR